MISYSIINQRFLHFNNWIIDCVLIDNKYLYASIKMNVFLFQ